MRLACLLALALAAPALAADAPAKAPAAFIERSLVEVPKAVGDLTLTDAHTYPDRAEDGVGMNFAIAGHPEVRFDVFAYPAGRQPPAEALDAAMTEIEASILELGRQGTYRDIQFAAVAPFAVTLPPAPRRPADATDEPADDAEAAPDPKTDKAEDPAKAAALGELLDAVGVNARPLEGRRRALTFVLRDAARQSIAYVFYRRLFYVKVRATAARDALAPEAFAQVVDAAVGAVVPAIEVTNVGACGAATIHAGGKPDAFAQELMAELTRLEREGCSTEVPDTPLPAGHERLTLVFPADAWRAKP
jgi:hypothetical protein